MRKGIVVGFEEPLGLKRHASGDDKRSAEAGIAFVQLDIVGNPQCSRVTKRGVGSREVQIARPACRKIYIATGTERHSNEQVQPLSLRLEKCLNRDVVRDIVSGRAELRC